MLLLLFNKGKGGKKEIHVSNSSFRFSIAFLPKRTKLSTPSSGNGIRRITCLSGSPAFFSGQSLGFRLSEVLKPSRERTLMPSALAWSSKEAGPLLGRPNQRGQKRTVEKNLLNSLIHGLKEKAQGSLSPQKTGRKCGVCGLLAERTGEI